MACGGLAPLVLLVALTVASPWIDDIGLEEFSSIDHEDDPSNGLSGTPCSDSIGSAKCHQLLDSPPAGRGLSCDTCCLRSGMNLGAACRKTCERCDPPSSGPGYQPQLEALEALYHSTNLSGLSPASHWMNTSLSYCFWSGVNCDAYSNITSLMLNGIQLAGTISDHIEALTSLQTVMFQSDLQEGGRLSGTLPHNFPANNLQIVNLYNNLLSGTINPIFKQDRHLVALDLHSNRFSGSLPTLSSNALYNLGLNLNSFSGSIPQAYGSLLGLELLYTEGKLQ